MQMVNVCDDEVTQVQCLGEGELFGAPFFDALSPRPYLDEIQQIALMLSALVKLFLS
jgi:hypothetical protein